MDRLVSSGSLSIENARLAGFDLGAKMSTIERLAGIKTGPNTEIQVLSAEREIVAGRHEHRSSETGRRPLSEI